MNYTREPTVETVITSKEGSKLVVRNSKGAAAEEFMVDAVEIVCFGHASFFRSDERPKPFLVPVTDYEVLEVREARVMLKSASLEKAVKIRSTREGRDRKPKSERQVEERASVIDEELELDLESDVEGDEAGVEGEVRTDGKPEVRPGREQGREEGGRDRKNRRRPRRKRGRDEEGRDDAAAEVSLDDDVAPLDGEDKVLVVEADKPAQPFVMPKLSPPPAQLISETMDRYKQQYAQAIVVEEEEAAVEAEGEEDAEVLVEQEGADAANPRGGRRRHPRSRRRRESDVVSPAVEASSLQEDDVARPTTSFPSEIDESLAPFPPFLHHNHVADVKPNPES